MNRYDAVLFDLDGTLLYTLPDLYNSINYALEAHGYPRHTVDEVRRFVGDGAAALIARACPPGASPEEREAVRHTYSRHYGAHKNDNTAPYPGIDRVLSALAERGVGAAVVTNKTHLNAEPMIRAFFGNSIALVEGFKEGRPTKPAPDAALDAMRALGSTPERTLFVGDSGVDARTAENAGMDCLLAAWGYWDRDRLEACPALAILDRAEQILDYL